MQLKKELDFGRDRLSNILMLPKRELKNWKIDPNKESRIN